METTETSTKKSSKGSKRMIIIIIACVLGFALIVTMLVDLILVSLSVAPLFSRIISKTHEDTIYGTVTEGHGILYSTITSREEFANGYFSSYNFFFGPKKWDETMSLETEFYQTEANETVLPPDDFEYEEDIDFDGYVLNMDAVRELAFNTVSPFEFMERFPGILTGDDPVTYFAALPNDYVVQIEYSGTTVNYVRLEDHHLDIFINLLTQSLEMDSFLLERNQP